MDSSIIFFLLVIFSSLVSSEACNAVDKEALLHFKHQIISDPSYLLQSWNSSSDCCTDWQGVSCDSSRRVVELSRPGLPSSMIGTLSPYLGNIENLRTLNLSRNKLSGSIPESMGKLKKLEVLDLEDNDLSGNIPIELGDAEQLRSILLSNNKLNGSIPKNVMNLKNLKDFGISGNNISASSFQVDRSNCWSPSAHC